jgi:hypothetical protein
MFLELSTRCDTVASMLAFCAPGIAKSSLWPCDGEDVKRSCPFILDRHSSRSCCTRKESGEHKFDHVEYYK